MMLYANSQNSGFSNCPPATRQQYRFLLQFSLHLKIHQDFSEAKPQEVEKIKTEHKRTEAQESCYRKSSYLNVNK